MAKAGREGPRDSVWLSGEGRRGGRRGGQPSGLDRDRITGVTVRLLDTEGLTGFSMRRLAAELNVTAMSVSRLPSASRIFSAPTSTVNAVGSARRDVRMSTSTAVHAPIAASMSSTGVNSPSDPVPTGIVPPRSFVTVYLPAASRAMLTCRCVSCVILLG